MQHDMITVPTELLFNKKELITLSALSIKWGKWGKVPVPEKAAAAEVIG